MTNATEHFESSNTTIKLAQQTEHENWQQKMLQLNYFTFGHIKAAQQQNTAAKPSNIPSAVSLADHPAGKA